MDFNGSSPAPALTSYYHHQPWPTLNPSHWCPTSTLWTRCVAALTETEDQESIWTRWHVCRQHEHTLHPVTPRDKCKDPVFGLPCSVQRHHPTNPPLWTHVARCGSLYLSLKINLLNRTQKVRLGKITSCNQIINAGARLCALTTASLPLHLRRLDSSTPEVCRRCNSLWPYHCMVGQRVDQSEFCWQD